MTFSFNNQYEAQMFTFTNFTNNDGNTGIEKTNIRRNAAIERIHKKNI